MTDQFILKLKDCGAPVQTIITLPFYISSRRPILLFPSPPESVMSYYLLLIATTYYYLLLLTTTCYYILLLTTTHYHHSLMLHMTSLSATHGPDDITINHSCTRWPLYQPHMCQMTSLSITHHPFQPLLTGPRQRSNILFCSDIQSVVSPPSYPTLSTSRVPLSS